MITILVQTHWSTVCVQHLIFLQIYPFSCSSVFSKPSQTYCLTKFITGNYSPSFHLTSQPVTDVTMKFWRQRSDLNNLFSTQIPSVFCFSATDVSASRFAITTSRHIAFTYNTVMITIHKFSITRSQFLSIFYFHYAIMLMMYKWLHCLP